MPRYDPYSGRKIQPRDKEHLWRWIYLYTGVEVVQKPVCDGHHAPLDIIACWNIERPVQALCEGPRGGGKSFLSAIDTHLDSRHRPGHGTRILAGSKAQAQQIHGGLKEAIIDGKGPGGGSDSAAIRRYGKEFAEYQNGSRVQILTASVKSVRGPHVPSLRMDEVDEIDPAIRQDSMGMVLDKGTYSPKVIQTSTHHVLGGPMQELKERALEANAAEPGSYPLHQFCVWEVLERCPEDRSGRWVGGDQAYENCPTCPLLGWCHDDRDRHGGIPKAKRAQGGHYTVESLIQKVRSVSKRVLEADYFCLGPKADGIWFPEFDDSSSAGNVRAVEIDGRLPIRLAIDCGVSYHTGAVFYQAWKDARLGERPQMAILADYYAEGLHSQQNALGILKVAQSIGLTKDHLGRIVLDPASTARSGVGPAAFAEYQDVFGEGRVHLAPHRPVSDGLGFLEMLVRLADGSRSLFVHPRCSHAIPAFRGYRRHKRGGQWMGYPADPQHPFEELIDSIRYGMWDAFPGGYQLSKNFDRVHASMVV